jgi:hypothetical protein
MFVFIDLADELTDSVFDGEVLLDLFGRRVGLLYG